MPSFSQIGDKKILKAIRKHLQEQEEPTKKTCKRFLLKKFKLDDSELRDKENKARFKNLLEQALSDHEADDDEPKKKKRKARRAKPKRRPAKRKRRKKKEDDDFVVEADSDAEGEFDLEDEDEEEDSSRKRKREESDEEDSASSSKRRKTNEAREYGQKCTKLRQLTRKVRLSSPALWRKLNKLDEDEQIQELEELFEENGVDCSKSGKALLKEINEHLLRKEVASLGDDFKVDPDLPAKRRRKEVKYTFDQNEFEDLESDEVPPPIESDPSDDESDFNPNEVEEDEDM